MEYPVVFPSLNFPSSLIILLTVTFTFNLDTCEGQHYANATAVFDDKLGPNSGYNSKVRPLWDQSKVIQVNAEFDIVAIVEMDDINQKFIFNGFMSFSWTDEIVAWDLAAYNNVFLIHPDPRDIWRPRTSLMNTMGERDLFRDDYSSITVLYDGSTTWYPGNMFPASCKLDLKKYPFDAQTCELMVISMGLSVLELNFTSSRGMIGTLFFVESGEWEIVDSKLETGSFYTLAYIRIEFRLQRRAGFFVINIVLPIVMLSFLNILVFLIPVDSGEKISYGITVLLALSVFMSIVSGMLPKSSDITPLVNVYLLSLLIISVCTVIVAIILVWMHHREGIETKRLKAKSTFKGMLRKVQTLNRPFPPDDPDTKMDTANETKFSVLNIINKLKQTNNLLHALPEPQVEEGEVKERSEVNKYKVIGRYVDLVSFIVFMFIWVSITIGFIVAIAS